MKIKKLPVWEILVPSYMPRYVSGVDCFTGWKFWTPYSKKVSRLHHQIWDDHVSNLTGGLTIHSTIKGRWMSDRKMHAEPMITVTIACTEEVLTHVIALTKKHYRQESVYVTSLKDREAWLFSEGD